MSLHQTFCGIVFAESWNTGMTWTRNVTQSLALKRASVMKKCGTLVFFTLAARRRKHLSPLSSAQIRCLYLFRVDEINPEWGTVGQPEKERERATLDKGERQGSSLVFNCLCVSMWADGIYWKAISARSGDWSADPLLWPPYSCHQQPPFLPPRALLPALIHSHCETACIMLSNRNNPQEMEHPMDSRVWGRKMAKGLRIKGAI